KHSPPGPDSRVPRAGSCQGPPRPEFPTPAAPCTVEETTDLALLGRDGYTVMKLARLGIVTLGSVCARISPRPPMSQLRLRRYAVTAYTSSSVSDWGCT